MENEPRKSELTPEEIHNAIKHVWGLRSEVMPMGANDEEMGAFDAIEKNLKAPFITKERLAELLERAEEIKNRKYADH